MSTDTQLPPAAVVVQHPVADFDAWKAGFDAHEGVRREVGILGHHINRAEEDPDLVTIYLAVTDVDRVKAFAASDELKQIMEEVGVTGPPQMTWVTPVRQDIVWDRELPAIVVSHEVADFDAWLEGYDAADGLRSEAGILGHAANRGIDDPSTVLVYHQAESADALRAFLDHPALGEAMEKAGVTSEPEISFHTGGWAKLYD